ncbi:MAG: HlyD family efflux transporter periplasmic adaptor subunit [Cyanobacteria bacterium P01_F01_bin.150]
MAFNHQVETKDKKHPTDIRDRSVIDSLPSLVGKPKRKRKRWLIIGTLALATSATVIAYVVNRSLTGQNQVDINALTEEIQEQSIDIQVSASGVVQPLKNVNISPKVAGRVDKLFVEQGDIVSEGQLIAQMENADLRAQVQEAKANLGRAKARLDELEAGNRRQDIAAAEANVASKIAQLEEGKAALVLANQQVERNQSLVDQGAISQDDFDLIKTEQDRASANVRQLQATLSEANQQLELLQDGSRPESIAAAAADVTAAAAQLALSETILEDSFLRAPFSGEITQRYATEGAFVTPTTSVSDEISSTSASVVALAQGAEVLARVTEADIHQIKPEQEVQIVADAYPDEIFTGRVLLVAPVAIKQRDVTLFEVRISLNDNQLLKSGMNVDLEFIGDQIEGALIVSAVAIVSQNGETGVLVPNEDNQPEFRPVEVGTAVDDKIQIVEGISAGERVFLGLPPGQTFEDIQ